MPLLLSLLPQADVDTLGQRQLAQLLLCFANDFPILRQLDICIGQGVPEVAHQRSLQLALARIRPLPLASHPLLDQLYPAITAILDHAIHTQCRQLLVATGGSLLDRRGHAARNHR
ncbi:hypothetical protein D3C81_1521140 [compost metagenome]